MKNILIAFLVFFVTCPVFAAEVINSGATNPVVPYGDYINFGSKIGSPGYGFRTNNGTIEFKNLAGSWTTVGGGVGDVVGPASSVDNEISLFSGTTGKVIKRATTTGIVKSTSGVISSVTTSAGLAGEISDETGSGALVFGTSPVFTTQITSPLIVSSGAMGVTPAAGSNLNINLSTTGDFAVNTSQLYVDTSLGNVGIGETVPGSKLSVSGGGSFGAAYDTTAAPANGLIVEGDVGIGTTAPAAKLDVSGVNAVVNTTSHNQILRVTDAVAADIGPQLGFWTKYTAAGAYQGIAAIAGRRENATDSNLQGYLQFITSNNSGSLSEKMRITSSGDVGIGTTGPEGKLHIWSSSAGTVNPHYTGSDLVVETGATAGGISIITSDAATGRILWTSPATTADIGARIMYQQSTDLMTIGPGGGNLYIKTGNVSIGTSTPSAQLHTTGTVRFQNFGAGTATFDANGNISSVSDERFKTIKGGFTVGLNQILGIKPIMYSWNELSGLDKDNTYTGFSAQNVRKYIPEAISIDAKGYYNMQDKTLIAALVNSVKQLTKEVDELRVALNLVKIDRTSIDRLGDSTAVIKSKIAYLEKECEITEIVKEPKTVVENIDGSEVTKTVEVLKEGITEKAGKYYRLETYEEAALRYSATSQN